MAVAIVLESAAMIWLASNSPRRRELLALGGWSFTVKPVEVDETPLPGEASKDYVQRLAVTKARAVAAQLIQGGAAGFPDTSSKQEVVVAADTTVVSQADDGSQELILGKPANPADAQAMLRSLRGRSHRVYTGLAILRLADNLLVSGLCETLVYMRNYSDDEMLAYIASGDPLDKAGAYAVQHPGFHPVEHLSGCYANVVGLPLCSLARLLMEVGIPSPVEAKLAQACGAELQYDCPFYPLEPL